MTYSLKREIGVIARESLAYGSEPLVILPMSATTLRPSSSNAVVCSSPIYNQLNFMEVNINGN